MSNRNPHLWRGYWEAVLEPAEIEFVPYEATEDILDIKINGRRVGWLEKRPGWCDRGHWKFGCELPEINDADSFPRYYMDVTRAKLEIIAWLNWRLWQKWVV